MSSAAVTVWVDGELVGERASIVATDHGITVGDGVFETCKVVDGRVFALERHHDRLDRSLAGLGLPPADRDLLDEGVAAVLGDLPGLVRLRYTVTAGDGPLGSDRLDGPMTHIVMATPIPAPASSAKVAVVPWTRNERSAVAGLKTTSYAENVVALRAAKEQDASEAILANTVGELCEGTGSNIFIVLDGVVHTPSLECGPLAGITRALVIEAGRAAGIDVIESTLPLAVLESCDEAFLTSSTRDVQEIHAIGDRDLSSDRPLTRALATAFADLQQQGMDDPR